MSKNGIKPKKSGVARTPVVMQQEELECGAASLTMVLAYYGKWLPLARVREECSVGRNGVTAKNIAVAARRYGLNALGCRMGPEMLKKDASFPCIIHWQFHHFVVLRGFRGDKVYINDPAGGAITVSFEEFDNSYTGVCLLFEPSETFQPEGMPVSTLTYVRQRLKGSGRAVAFAVIIGAIMSLVGVLSPGFKRVFTDHLITQTAPEWVTPFMWSLFIISVLQIITSVFSDVYTRRIGCKMAAVGNSDFFWKLLKVPVEFFEQRRIGDLAARQQSNANITNILINSLTPLLFQMLSMVFYFAVMLRYSWILACVGVICMVVGMLSAKIAANKYRNTAHVYIREKSRMTSTMTACISMMDTIKSAGAEGGCFGVWAGMSANVNIANVEREKTNLISGSIPVLIANFADMTVLALGTLFAIQGNMTVGMIMALQGFVSSFLRPAQAVMSVGQEMQVIRTEIERVDDVMNYPDEHVFADEDTANVKGKLSGRVEMKNVTFGYTRQGRPVISDFNLTLEPGKRVALVGRSGCGKSTIGKLLIGLHQPWSGEILFDGKRMSEIPKDVFYSSVAIVNQDVMLFEGTIQDNIKNYDEEVSDMEMVKSALDAKVHDIILSRPDGYHNCISEGGKDLSGGQRQMIEIARALAGQPRLLILDEATSALDTETEYGVAQSVKNIGITSVVIAHRLSTIRSCDEIIVLDNGGVIGRGTHDELLETCEEYRTLIKSV